MHPQARTGGRGPTLSGLASATAQTHRLIRFDCPPRHIPAAAQARRGAAPSGDRPSSDPLAILSPAPRAASSLPIDKFLSI